MIVLSRQRTFLWRWRIRFRVTVACINLRIWIDLGDGSTESLATPNICLPLHKLDSPFIALIFFSVFFSWCFLFLSFLSSFLPFYGLDPALLASVTVFLTLQTRKLRHREVKCLLHGHTASKGQTIICSGLLTPKVRTLCSVSLSSGIDSSSKVQQL